MTSNLAGGIIVIGWLVALVVVVVVSIAVVVVRARRVGRVPWVFGGVALAAAVALGFAAGIFVAPTCFEAGPAYLLGSDSDLMMEYYLPLEQRLGCQAESRWRVGIVMVVSVLIFTVWVIGVRRVLLSMRRSQAPAPARVS